MASPLVRGALAARRLGLVAGVLFAAACGSSGNDAPSAASEAGSNDATAAGDSGSNDGTAPGDGSTMNSRDGGPVAAGDGATPADAGTVGTDANGTIADAGLPANCTAPTSYANLFTDVLGTSANDVNAKVTAAFQSLFHGDNSSTVYYAVGTNQAYILDVYDNDVRTEGMSYGMMIAVQLDKQTEFDALWSWAKQYMYQSTGPHAGYFEWHLTSAGAAISSSINPAPDGEEYFATALIFASKRWGNGTGIFDYASEARALLDVMVHEGESPDAQEAGVTSMFDPTAKLVVFVPNATTGAATFTDPSYVMPAFYDIWACFDAKNTGFWQSVSATSRAFLPKATNAMTGLAPEYAAFDGTPSTQSQKGDFRFDAWRVAMNVMADLRYWGKDPWQSTYGSRLAGFFASQGTYGDAYSLTGTELDMTHSAGLVAINATLGFALPVASAKPLVQELWNLPVPTGQARYYNGMLYMLALLHASGQFHLWF
jgi:oligosaccharide reducing-end xylanase